MLTQVALYNAGPKLHNPGTTLSQHAVIPARLTLSGLALISKTERYHV